MFIQITGGREWDDVETIAKALLDVRPDGAQKGDVVRHGNCRGADKQAAAVAKALGFGIDKMPAEWRNHEGCRCNAWRIANSYCGYAGPRRNRQMLDKPVDIVLAFHRNLASSSGTKDCVDEALRRGMTVWLYDGVNERQVLNASR